MLFAGPSPKEKALSFSKNVEKATSLGEKKNVLKTEAWWDTLIFSEMSKFNLCRPHNIQCTGRSKSKALYPDCMHILWSFQQVK